MVMGEDQGETEKSCFSPSSCSTLLLNTLRGLLITSAPKMPFSWWKLLAQPNVEDSGALNLGKGYQRII